jgi:hypothetical protein
MPPKKNTKNIEHPKPSNMLSIFSIIISVSVLLFTWYNSRDQNKKWNHLNLGKIDVISVKFTYFREIETKDFDSIQWGYPVQVITDPESKIMQNGKYIVQNTVVAKDLKTGRIYGDESSITLNELRAELSHLNIPNYTYLEFQKKYYVDIHLQNIGPTECYIKKQQIFIKDSKPPNDLKLIFESNDSFKFESQRGNHTQFALSIPIMTNLPQPFEIFYEIAYDDINQENHLAKYKFSYEKAQWQMFTLQ